MCIRDSTGPVVRSLERMLAMRAYQRGKHVDQVENVQVLNLSLIHI